MCPSKIHMLKHNPPNYGIWRWSIWEGIRSWGWNPHRGDQCPHKIDPGRSSVLTSQRYYWTHSSNWTLGACRDILISHTNISTDFEEAFLLFSRKVNNHYSLFTNSPPLIQYVKWPLGRLGLWIMTTELWASMMFSKVPSYIVSFLPPFPPLWRLRAP